MMTDEEEQASVDRMADQELKLLTAVAQIVVILGPLSEHERDDVIVRLPYCPHCWCDDPHRRCQCWNDE